jgi:hypothetical protein
MNHFISNLLECQLPFQEDNEERIKLAECLMKQDENAPSLLELFEDVDVARTISKFETLTDSSIISSNSVNFVPFIGFLTMDIIILKDYMNITDPSPIYFEGGIFKSDVIDSSNPNEKIIRLEAAKCAFELGCMLDSMSGHLYYIMFLFVENDLDQMVEVMNELLEKSLTIFSFGLDESMTSDLNIPPSK